MATACWPTTTPPSTKLNTLLLPGRAGGPRPGPPAATWTAAPTTNPSPAASSTGSGSSPVTRPSASMGSSPPPRSRTRPISTSQSSTSLTSLCRPQARITRTAWPARCPCCQKPAARFLTRVPSQDTKATGYAPSPQDSGVLRTASHPRSAAAADPSGKVRRSLAAHLPDKPQYEDLRNNLGHDIRRSVRTALKAAD
jgi:hypothetical protein